MVSRLKVMPREVSPCLPFGDPLVPPRILRPPGPPLRFCASSPFPFRAGRLLSTGTFRSFIMVFVRALSAIPKVPLLRVIPFLAPCLKACRVLSSLLRAGETVREPAAGLLTVRSDAGFVRTDTSLPPIEDMGLLAALPTVSREVMGLT